MDDLNNFDDKYVIGFTEIQYRPQEENASPTPSEHTIGYTSPALEYAERTNRGELRQFRDHSFYLDRKQRHSVHKIHSNILDLVFEQTERRKSMTPSLTKSSLELYRSDSVISHLSDVSIKTSSSLPIIKVQQLPPLNNRGHAKLSPSSKDVCLSSLESHEYDGSYSRSFKSRDSNMDTDTDAHTMEPHVTKVQINVRSRKDVKKTISTLHDGEMHTVFNKECAIRESQNKKITCPPVVETHRPINSVVKQTNLELHAEKPPTLDVISRLHNNAQLKGNIRTNLKNKLSFCQSSYNEKTERERMNNIRRRHMSQTKLGPLDFNKLRRQLTIGKSYTMCN